MGKKRQVKQTERERQCKKISKQRANRQRIRVIARRVGAALSVAFLGVAGTAGWSIYENGELSRWQQQAVEGFWQSTADAGFGLQNVYLHGHKKVEGRAILAATGLQNGQPILGYSLTELQQKLEAVPMVRHAHIARILPNTLAINIEERAPVAVWQYQGKLQLVDADGVVLEPVGDGHYQNLPLLVGQMEPAHVQKFFAFLAKAPRLQQEMQSATLVSQRRWNIVLKKGMEVKLPENNLELAWQKLDELVAQKKLENMLSREDIQMIDLRMPDRMFIKQVKPDPEAPMISEQGAQNT